MKAFAAVCLLLIMGVCNQMSAHGATPASVDEGFRATVLPFIEDYCLACHDKGSRKGRLDLSVYVNADSVANDLARWDLVLEQLEHKAMPPLKTANQPEANERAAVIGWIQSVRKREASRHSGDPGRVSARRLSNAEYDHTIRDLTGVDLRPTREFPVDPANRAGFDNSSESLTMSPALMKKYLEAARSIAEHLVLAPHGLEFAEHPVLTDTDRDKYCTRKIIDFYNRQPTDYADYFLAAWRFENRSTLGKPGASLGDMAIEARISPKYLATIWSILTERGHAVGPIAAIQLMWRELPPPGAGTDPEASARAGCRRMRDFVVDARKRLTPRIANLTAPLIENGSQPLVLWKNRQFVANRRRYTGGIEVLMASPPESGTPATRALAVPTNKGEIGRYEPEYARFCSTFPDAFLISERARMFLDNPDEDKLNVGRYLSAGFHNMMGYFRDDGPLYELILDSAGQRELDALWLEFDCVTGSPIRQHSGFIWYERTEPPAFMGSPEFEFARAEDKNATSEPMMSRLARVYYEKARKSGASPTALQAIKDHFEISSANIRRVEKARLAAEPKHLEALQDFARRAYRRPLSKEERADIVKFYQTLRSQDSLSHEEAVRDTLVSILLAPDFCFRVDPPRSTDPVQPLSEHELASRLSYFLWSSMPDGELMSHADAGDLHRRDVLTTQARRMVRDPKVSGLAVEFAGNWLDFRRFEEHNSVDRGRFPSFNDELRQAMFEEPIRFFIDIVSNDRSIHEFLDASHTFVNPVLARHYAMPVPKIANDAWVRVDDARAYGRGGLLTMGVFLTKNSPGLRTSPVKRGYWVVRRLLGENIPSPPPNVPELPSDESKLQNITLRQALARHRADKSCAGCHERFDAIGLAYEGYGPVGEARKLDLGGRPVDARAEFPKAKAGTGIEGLRGYLIAHREEEFVDNLCRKLLAYALGRTLIPSDDETITTMRKQLDSHESRFSALVETIITSPQFLNRRVEAQKRAENRL